MLLVRQGMFVTRHVRRTRSAKQGRRQDAATGRILPCASSTYSVLVTHVKTFLWFGGHLDEALAFYEATFDDVSVGDTQYLPTGELFTADFSIHGHEFIGLNWPGGPPFNDAISLSVNVDGQDEVDRLWAAITADGREGQCGWCHDKWGVTWQISPIQMRYWLTHPDDDVREFANERLQSMSKIIIDDLHR